MIVWELDCVVVVVPVLLTVLFCVTLLDGDIVVVRLITDVEDPVPDTVEVRLACIDRVGVVEVVDVFDGLTDTDDVLVRPGDLVIAELSEEVAVPFEVDDIDGLSVPVLEEVIDLDRRALEVPVLELVVVAVIVVVCLDDAERRALADILGEAEDVFDMGADLVSVDDPVDVLDDLTDTLIVGDPVGELEGLEDVVGVLDLAIVIVGFGDAVIDFVVSADSVLRALNVPVLLGKADAVFIFVWGPVKEERIVLVPMGLGAEVMLRAAVLLAVFVDVADNVGTIARPSNLLV